MCRDGCFAHLSIFTQLLGNVSVGDPFNLSLLACVVEIAPSLLEGRGVLLIARTFFWTALVMSLVVVGLHVNLLWVLKKMYLSVSQLSGCRAGMVRPTLIKGSVT